MDISTWLIDATKQLKHIGVESNRLDAELILAETLRKPRTYLHAHLGEEIDSRRLDIANARLELRLERVPLAYILGKKEFFGREFVVTTQVLIPRPESEDLVEVFLEISASEISDEKTLIDIGTGSGCLGVTAKLERPNISVILSDISSQALEVARSNAATLGALVRTQKQDLLFGQIEPLDYILANLPYVDKAWKTSPEVEFEPELALFADDKGLALIAKLIPQVPRHLRQGGYLLLEADPEQHQDIISLAERFGLRLHLARNYCLSFILTES